MLAARAHRHTSHPTSIAVLCKSDLCCVQRCNAHCQSFLVPLHAEDKRHGSGSCVRCHKAAAVCVHRSPVATVCCHVLSVSFHFSGLLQSSKLTSPTTAASSQEKYSGQWVQNLYHGVCPLSRLSCEHWLISHCVNDGKLQAPGRIVDEKGTLYEGEWRYGSELSQCDSM